MVHSATALLSIPILFSIADGTIMVPIYMGPLVWTMVCYTRYSMAYQHRRRRKKGRGRKERGGVDVDSQ